MAKTHRAVIVDEGWRSGSLAAEVSARIMEQAFYELDAPVERVCSAEVPMPYPRHLEEAALPQARRDRRRRAPGGGLTWPSSGCPSLGADMDEGTVLEWLVKPGDEVRKGDVIAVIDTAKSAIDVESFCTGDVEQLDRRRGSDRPVGTVLATISEPQGRKRRGRRRKIHAALRPSPP